MWTNKLRAFNAWRDDFLIEASTLLLIAGFVMGTVDIFVGGGIATQEWFKVSWAIVQALAIDGLFFAVWGRVARATWTRDQMGKNAALVGVGLVLALVAALVNDILTYQQINGIADSIDAIRKLGIDVTAFTHIRAVLVVGVGVLVQLFCRSELPQLTGIHTVHQRVDREENSELPQLTEVNEVDEQVHQLLTEVNTVDESVHQVFTSSEQVDKRVNTGEHEPLTKKQQVSYWLTDGSKSSTEIAELVGVSKSYVSKVKSEASKG